MLFNSAIFLLFFVVFYAAYLLSRKHLRLQNFLILAGSYLFYGWWDWRFLGLIVVSTLVDYSVGRLMSRSDQTGSNRKRLLLVSVVTNLGILGFFKYFNFFTQSAVDFLELIGFAPDPVTLNIILPVGISFYTFQTMSYTIDVYRRKIPACESLLNFGVFVAFFPQLVAGPIERASRLLPQISHRRVITAAGIQVGIFLIIYGYFQKVFIADNLAKVVNEVFGKHEAYSDLDLVLAVVAFSIQIYCDFSGYSKIARGLAKLMGFELMVNFRLPYFALNPSDFWQRWHISLSTWLRDYLYISLGGNRAGAYKTYRNLAITMLLGGLWHGAAWNFVLWGAFHGAILIIYRAAASIPEKFGKLDKGINLAPARLLRWAIMLSLTLFGWLLFRATSAEQIWYFIENASFEATRHSSNYMKAIVFYTWPLIALQLVQHFKRDLLIVLKTPWLVRAVIYAIMIAMILALGVRESPEFIYFQF